MKRLLAFYFAFTKQCRILVRLATEKAPNLITKGRFLFLFLSRFTYKSSHMFKLLLLVLFISLINLRIVTFGAQYLYAEYNDYEAGVESFVCYDTQVLRIDAGPDEGLFIRCEDYDNYYDESKIIKFYELKEIQR